MARWNRQISAGSGTRTPAPAEVQHRYEPFTIVYARRTFSGWLSAVLDAGLAVEAVAEPCADERTAAGHPEVADSRIVPTSCWCAPASREGWYEF